MILLIIFVLLFIGSLVWWKIQHDNGNFMPSGAILASGFGTGLFTILFLIFLNPYIVRSEIAEFNATKQTIADVRIAEISDIERAALTQKIIEANKWLAKTQCNNKNLVDIFIPDEIDELEPLK